MSSVDESYQLAADRLGDLGVPERFWNCGTPLGDDRVNLVRTEAGWVVGYFERGRWAERDEVADRTEAISLFVAKASALHRETERVSAATDEWLRRQGRGRP